MESSVNAMSTRLKQRAVIEFLSAENVNLTDIHRRLMVKLVYIKTLKNLKRRVIV